jgi:hypothetical protein
MHCARRRVSPATAPAAGADAERARRSGPGAQAEAKNGRPPWAWRPLSRDAPAGPPDAPRSTGIQRESPGKASDIVASAEGWQESGLSRAVRVNGPNVAVLPRSETDGFSPETGLTGSSPARLNESRAPPASSTAAALTVHSGHGGPSTGKRGPGDEGKSEVAEQDDPGSQIDPHDRLQR